MTSHRIAILLLGVGLGCGAVGNAFAQDSAVAQSQELAETTTAAEKPEAVLRAFMLALVSADADALKKHAMPHKQLSALLLAERPPQEAVAQMKTMFSKMPMSRLKVGDSIDLPNGKKLAMTDTHINDDRVMLSFTNSPMPFQLIRHEGVWRVNAKPLISARKAAAAAKSKSN